MNIGTKIMFWMMWNYRDSVKFAPDDYMTDKLFDLIWNEEYNKLLFDVGIIVYLGIMKWHEQKEMYKVCQDMIDVINKYNEKYNFNLPVDFFDDQIKEWMKLTPTEFLNLELK